MPQYKLHDIPVDLWARFKERATRENWPLRPLFLQLMDDYAAGRISASAQPPVRLQTYAWLRPFWRRLARHVENRPIDAQWLALRDEVVALRPQHGAALQLLSPDAWRPVIDWLKRTSRDPRPSPNQLSMRAITHEPTRDGRHVVTAYEVLGLPPGQEAWVSYFAGHGWMFLRAFNGQQDAAWRGHYASAREALQYIETELFLEEDPAGRHGT